MENITISGELQYAPFPIPGAASEKAFRQVIECGYKVRTRFC